MAGVFLMEEGDRFTIARAKMVSEQIVRRGVNEPRLVRVLQRVPRHLFVPLSMRDYAYEDRPLPIGNGQTISQPYIVGLMTSLLALKGDEVVLEVGTGSGYQAAVLAEMAGTVHSIERFEDLAKAAAVRLVRLGYYNTHVHCADGSLGWPEAAPYNGIIVTAAAATAPSPLLEQLADGGRLVIPVGSYHGQILQLWTRESGRFDCEDVLPVSFVPLRGKYGWSPEEWENPEIQDEP